uniref:Enoyl-[acyl-carrier-protein] reductase, mitochondrial n=1 Tax=Steinernema glaseri TaxID=37863 RepID=A0A1I8A949_9BILA
MSSLSMPWRSQKDINKIQGRYPLRPDYPAVGGSEAVGVVEAVGANVTSVQKGDTVISNSMANSVWTQYDVVGAERVLRVRKDLDVVKMGLKTINIVRDRPEITALKKELKNIGADYVFTEEEFAKDNVKFIQTLHAPPKLALNGVGGRSAMVICAALCHGGTVVTYGAMSKKPMEILSSSFIFKDLRAFGVAVGPWMQVHPEKADRIMIALQDMLVKGTLSPPPMDELPMADFAIAMQRTLAGGHKKQLLLLHDNVRSNNTCKSKL